MPEGSLFLFAPGSAAQNVDRLILRNRHLLQDQGSAIFLRQIQPKWMASHIICEPFMLGDKSLFIVSANGDSTPNLILRSALAS